MAGASDKARFYLEQNVPELREWERRGVFTKAEIASINAQRSTFEHTICSRGSSTAATYARYIAFEMNLATLAKKRTRRLVAPSGDGKEQQSTGRDATWVKSSQRTAEARVLRLFERGTRKHHGDLVLWMQYVDHCRQNKQQRRKQRVLTDMLRLFPTEPEVWIRAANEAEVDSSISEVRNMLKRGLQFCGAKKSTSDTVPAAGQLYLEWARLECRWLARIEGRRKVLGLEKAVSTSTSRPDQSSSVDEEAQSDHEQELIKLPELDLEAEENSNAEQAVSALVNTNIESLSKTPVMHGAIPLAIFDAARQHFPRNLTLCSRFFGLFCEFAGLSSISALLQHVLKNMEAVDADSPYTAGCKCRLPLVGQAVDSPQFPGAVRASMREIKSSLAQCKGHKALLVQEILAWLQPLRYDPKLVPAVAEALKILETQLRYEAAT